MVTFDVLILLQFWIYRDATAAKVRAEKDSYKKQHSENKID